MNKKIYIVLLLGVLSLGALAGGCDDEIEEDDEDDGS